MPEKPRKRLEWAVNAQVDLYAIYDYIAADNPRAAAAVVAAIVEAAGSLAQFSELGRPTRRVNTRQLVLARYPYRIVYHLRRDKVIIATVVHNARNIPNA